MNSKSSKKTLGLGLAFCLILVTSVVPALSVSAQEITEQEKRINYSLYYEDFKNGNYESCMPYLRWIIQNAPTFPDSRNDDSNFERLIEAYEGLSTDNENSEISRAYLDSALAVFDSAIPVLKENEADFSEITWKINKGRFIQNHSDQMEDLLETVPSIYLEAYELDPTRVDAYYMRLIIDDLVRKEDKQGAIDLMNRINDNYLDNPDMVAYIASIRNSLFRSPDERIAFLESELETKPDDIEIISELFGIYLAQNYRDEAHQLGQRLLEMQPTSRIYQLLGELHLEDGEAQEALDLYEQALDMPDAEGNRRDIYYNMGVAYQQMARLANARTYFRRAIQEDESFGLGYIAIGDLYAAAVSGCGSFEREDRAVYWLVTDYYERARSADQTVRNIANQKVNTYRRSFPDSEALFFKKWNPGDRYHVNYGCYEWINEYTRVREP